MCKVRFFSLFSQDDFAPLRFHRCPSFPLLLGPPSLFMTSEKALLSPLPASRIPSRARTSNCPLFVVCQPRDKNASELPTSSSCPSKSQLIEIVSMMNLCEGSISLLVCLFLTASSLLLHLFPSPRTSPKHLSLPPSAFSSYPSLPILFVLISVTAFTSFLPSYSYHTSPLFDC